MHIRIRHETLHSLFSFFIPFFSFFPYFITLIFLFCNSSAPSFSFLIFYSTSLLCYCTSFLVLFPFLVFLTSPILSLPPASHFILAQSVVLLSRHSFLCLLPFSFTPFVSSHYPSLLSHNCSMRKRVTRKTLT